jgi:hypothetical protein
LPYYVFRLQTLLIFATMKHQKDSTLINEGAETMRKIEDRRNRQFADTKPGRVRRDTRRAVIAFKRAWVDGL